MDASCSIQENIHECLIVLFNDVSRKLGTYHLKGVIFMLELPIK